jgi:hypothetical protein
MKFLLPVVLSIILFNGCSNNETVELRKFPYPYKAAFTIASDVDDTDSRDELVHIHKKISSEKNGFDLDIGDSFWMYNEQREDMKDSLYDIHSFYKKFSGPTPFLGISIFDGLSFTESKDAGVIKNLIRKGFIDALHSYGHFSANTFKREYAAEAIKYLKQNNLKFDVWIQHGGHENTNNVGPWPWQLGDNPNTKEYHTDLTVPYGIKFYWTGQMTHCIGQDGNFNLETSVKQIVEWLQDFYINIGSPIYKHDNELVTVLTLDDGQKIFDFVRYINRWGKYEITDEASLKYQLNSEILDELIDNEGYLIQYTHLGANYGYPYLSYETMQLLEYAKQKQDAGELLVSTTSKLLNYYVHRKYLNWDYELKDNHLKIIIKNISNEVEGKYVPTVKELEGITFYIPANVDCEILLNNKPIKFINNPKDFEGRNSVSIKWNFLNFD